MISYLKIFSPFTPIKYFFKYPVVLSYVFIFKIWIVKSLLRALCMCEACQLAPSLDSGLAMPYFEELLILILLGLFFQLVRVPREESSNLLSGRKMLTECALIGK